MGTGRRDKNWAAETSGGREAGPVGQDQTEKNLQLQGARGSWDPLHPFTCLLAHHREAERQGLKGDGWVSYTETKDRWGEKPLLLQRNTWEMGTLKCGGKFYSAMQGGLQVHLKLKLHIHGSR